ncbi:putative CRISPR-associated protein Cas6 [Mesotoga infera]|uniref:Putative CRISPR-associated protein Cas6 n=1 Tax=Mesotoga infera TaxID=1236046 RepID=A0A7Z7LEW3_9BACT|nr:CRISPR-associated endoribonuclease Cas6 [Mesotoga infera]SSC12697.1 putative CRISPR-associated protein Cas6 [Mesotoga infera]
MRFQIMLSGRSEIISLPLDYRSGFIHFFKKLAESSEMMDMFYARKSYKRFSFSVRLGSEMRIEGERLEAKLPAMVTFSTGDLSVFNSFLGSATKFWSWEEPLSIFTNTLFISGINVQRPFLVNKPFLKCKSYTHITLRDPENPILSLSTKDMEKFNFTLNSYMKEKFTAFTGRIPKGELSFEAGSGEFELVRHYNGFVGGYRGVFALSGPPDLLQFAYDYGLGHRTGQGFGLFSAEV